MPAEENEERRKIDAADVISLLGVGACVLAALWQVIDYVLLGNAQVVIDAFDEVIQTDDSSAGLVWTGFALSVLIWLVAAGSICVVAGGHSEDKFTVGATIFLSIALIIAARLLIELVYWIIGMGLVNETIYLVFTFYYKVITFLIESLIRRFNRYF